MVIMNKLNAIREYLDKVYEKILDLDHYAELN